MILTSECAVCKYGTIDESNKARIKVICEYKNKEYYYGQCIPCENKIKKSGGYLNDEESGSV